jgi:hypothetical protein
LVATFDEAFHVMIDLFGSQMDLSKSTCTEAANNFKISLL